MASTLQTKILQALGHDLPVDQRPALDINDL